MPELPEVETIKKHLDKTISGKRIVDIEILSKKQFPGNAKDARLLSKGLIWAAGEHFSARNAKHNARF